MFLKRKKPEEQGPQSSPSLSVPNKNDGDNGRTCQRKKNRKSIARSDREQKQGGGPVIPNPREIKKEGCRVLNDTAHYAKKQESKPEKKEDQL